MGTYYRQRKYTRKKQLRGALTVQTELFKFTTPEAEDLPRNTRIDHEQRRLESEEREMTRIAHAHNLRNGLNFQKIFDSDEYATKQTLASSHKKENQRRMHGRHGGEHGSCDMSEEIDHDALFHPEAEKRLLSIREVYEREAFRKFIKSSPSPWDLLALGYTKIDCEYDLT